LGNDSSKPSPGGNAALIEAPAGDSVARWDFYESSPQTTNNKMALAGAIATLEWIRRQWKRARVVYVSDSQYLVKGMSEWVAGWEARGWKRKGGVLENQELWKKLVQAAAAHHVEWRWIDGGMRGEDVYRNEVEFTPGPELTVAAALAAYYIRAAATDAAVRSMALTDPCPRAEGTDLRWVLLHLINETARHAGHADATRELLDGRTGE